MKKLNANELNVITSAVINKVNEKFTEDKLKLLSKDKHFNECKKIAAELEKKQSEVRSLSLALGNAQQLLMKKHNVYINIIGNKVSIMNNDAYMYNNIYNKLVLENVMGKDVYVMIDELVKEFAK